MHYTLRSYVLFHSADIPDKDRFLALALPVIRRCLPMQIASHGRRKGLRGVRRGKTKNKEVEKHSTEACLYPKQCSQMLPYRQHRLTAILAR